MPVGAPAPSAVTVAVKRTEVPTVDVACEDETAVEVGVVESAAGDDAAGASAAAGGEAAGSCPCVLPAPAGGSCERDP